MPAARLRGVRALVCVYATLFLFGRGYYLWQASALPEGRWHPIGLLGGLGSPPPRLLLLVVWLVGLAAGVAAACGRSARVTLPLFTGCFVALSTYGNSWGQLFHTEHLVSLHLLVLSGALLVGHRLGAGPAAAQGRESGWPLHLVSAITALTYLLAGLAKLRLGGWAWIDGDALRRQVAYDNIRKELVGSVSSPLAGTALAQRWVWGPLALATLVVELGAPLLVAWVRTRRWWALAAWLFHIGILALMAIAFLYPLSGVAFASMLPVERGVDRIDDRRRRSRDARTVRHGTEQHGTEQHGTDRHGAGPISPAERTG